MQKKIICIVLGMLLCATVSIVTGTEIFNKNDVNSIQSKINTQNRDMWDVQFKYEAGNITGSLYLVGVGFDGDYFYCPTFNSPTIYKFTKDGSYIGSFSISGVPNLIDLTYDGEYFYGQGQSPTNVIYKMNFSSQTLVGTIPSPHVAWNIAYDAYADGGNGGFWIGQWNYYLSLINRNGNVLTTITPPESMLGMAWDPWTKITGYNGPFLWIFTGTSTGQPGIIKVIDLDTKTLVPGVSRNVAAELGNGIAGGLEFTTDFITGTGTLFGMIQGASPVGDYIFGYEICITNRPPETPGAPSGPSQGVVGVEYTFTATTTDPEGDPIEYWFDWGDGQNSGWVSPGSAKHAWASEGTYNVRVKARDVHGGESGFSPAHPILILGGPILDIETVKGGMSRVKAVITNNGGVNATNVQWTISLTGGAWIGKESSGTVDVPIGEEVEITSKPIIGLGKTKITVTVTHPDSTDTTTRSGKIFLFYIYVRPGG